MRQNDNYQSLAVPVVATSNSRYSSTTVNAADIPRRHRRHHQSKKKRRSQNVIHVSIRPWNSTPAIDTKNSISNGGLELVPSYLLSSKLQYESKPYVAQSLPHWSNKISPTANVDTLYQRYDTFPIIRDNEQKSISTKNNMSINKISPSLLSEYTEDKINFVPTNSFRSNSRTRIIKNESWDMGIVDNYHQSSKQKNKYKKRCGTYCCCSCSPLWIFLALLLVALLIAAIASALIVVLAQTSTTTMISPVTTITTITTTTASTTTSTDTTTTSTTASTTTITTSTTTTISTTTTTAPYCATGCTGNYTTYSNATTCGLSCVDTGSYRCQNSSTYCPSGTFSYYGACNTTNTCPNGYCCVHDTYAASVPYICIICNTVG